MPRSLNFTGDGLDKKSLVIVDANDEDILGGVVICERVNLICLEQGVDLASSTFALQSTTSGGNVFVFTKSEVNSSVDSAGTDTDANGATTITEFLSRMALILPQ